MRYFGIYFPKGNHYDPLPPMADWFWNPVTGNDANTGRSPTDPFLTWSAVQANWDAGETLAVAAGSGIIRAEVMMPGSNSKIIRYGYDMGFGETTFDASEIVNKGDITVNGTYADVWEFTVTLPNEPSEPAFPQLWGDDLYFTYDTSVANVHANPGTFYRTGATGTVTYYFHTPDGSDPTVNSVVYTYSARLTGIYGAPVHGTYGSYSGCYVEYVSTRKNLAEGGSLKMGDRATLVEVSCYLGSKHNALVGEGTTWTGGIIQDAYYTAASTLIVYNDQTPVGLDITYQGLTLTLTSISPVPSNHLPMNGHNNVSGSFGTIYVINCSFSGFRSAGTAFGFNHTSTVVFTNPSFTNCAYGLSGPFNPACTVTVTGMTWSSTITVSAVNWSGTMAQLIMSDCTLDMDNASTIGLVFIGANNVVSITNCTFRTSLSAGLRVAIYAQQCPGATLTLSNNTFNTGSGSWSYHYLWLANASGMTWSSDYNAFEATNDTWNIFGTVYSDLASYQTATSQDAHSTST